MTAIKARILRIWETAATPVKLCCIKFAQRVVLAQTASNGMEQHKVRHAYPQNPGPLLTGELEQINGLDISLVMIPPNHPVLDPRQLEAEATGLLDRMLGVLQDNSR
jgi:symplekin